jgi:hypothetical protein
MAIAARRPSQSLAGTVTPRLSPPPPTSTWRDEYVALAARAGIALMPWQQIAARYLMARGRKQWRYREVCIVAARQNGKTELIKAKVLDSLKRGRKVLHTAQNRSLPRQVFIAVANAVDPFDLFSRPRFANGQEEIRTVNGGSYQIIAPQRGARGLSADDLIIDELREFEDFDFIAAAAPTLTASKDPQILYLSNAGHDDSVILNDIKRRAGEDDPGLAYLEWSAEGELDAGDPRAWAQANPALGRLPGLAENIARAYATLPSEVFETEHLCRWVASMVPSLVTDIAWRAGEADTLEDPVRPSLGIALDPNGRRASAYLAWQTSDGLVALRPLMEVEDDVALDIDELGKQLRQDITHSRVRKVGHSAITDQPLARYIGKPKPIDGREYANASQHFAALVEGHKIRWSGGRMTDELRNTVRKQTQAGAWAAVRSKDDKPIPSVLAAIRAVWLASGPKPAPPRIF